MYPTLPDEIRVELPENKTYHLIPVPDVDRANLYITYMSVANKVLLCQHSRAGTLTVLHAKLRYHFSNAHSGLT